MKTLEFNHGNDWRDKLLNRWPFCLDTKFVVSLFSIAYCKLSGESVWQIFGIGDDVESLGKNGAFFVRFTATPLTPIWWVVIAKLSFAFSFWFLILVLLYGFYFHISWRETGNKRYINVGLLHKLNGRLGAIFRIPLNDEKAAAGTHGPNLFQKTGWECGPK